MTETTLLIDQGNTRIKWVPAIDDGVRSREESLALLRGLASLGFSHCVATPHIRPGMFNNDAAGLQAAFDRLNEDYVAEPGLPERSDRTELDVVTRPAHAQVADGGAIGSLNGVRDYRQYPLATFAQDGDLEGLSGLVVAHGGLGALRVAGVPPRC